MWVTVVVGRARGHCEGGAGLRRARQRIHSEAVPPRNSTSTQGSWGTVRHAAQDPAQGELRCLQRRRRQPRRHRHGEWKPERLGRVELEAPGKLRGSHHGVRFRVLIGGVAGRVVTDPRTIMNPDRAGRVPPGSPRADAARPAATVRTGDSRIVPPSVARNGLPCVTATRDPLVVRVRGQVGHNWWAWWPALQT